MNTTQPENAHGTGIHWLWLALIVLILDQVSKYIVTQYFPYNKPAYVFSFLNITLEHNKGAAFSFLSQQGSLAVALFIGSAVVVSLVLCIWLYRLHARDHWLGISLALLLGGALGNLYDRIIYGYVVDFVHFHWNDRSFAIFNLADTSITLGAFMLIIDIFRRKKKA